jgi:acyl-CoA reductase-like NAD-dependent aldehyde dehydrogenase
VTQQVLGRQGASAAQVESAVQAARQAFPAGPGVRWKSVSVLEALPQLKATLTNWPLHR